MGRDWDFPEQVSVPINPDEHGLTGRECPQGDCEGYFKIEFGTGLDGEGLPCHCPYCGHTADHDNFWTKEQIEYAKSVAFREFDQAVRRELKKMEFDYPARGAFGIGISMKLKPSAPVPLRHYREKRLETEVVCDKCTLRYGQFQVQVEGEPDIKVWKLEELRTAEAVPGDHIQILSMSERAVTNRWTYVSFINMTRGGLFPLHFMVHKWVAAAQYSQLPQYFGVRNHRAVEQVLASFFYEVTYQTIRLCGESEAGARQFASENSSQVARQQLKRWRNQR